MTKKLIYCLCLMTASHILFAKKSISKPIHELAPAKATTLEEKLQNFIKDPIGNGRNSYDKDYMWRKLDDLYRIYREMDQSSTSIVDE